MFQSRRVQHRITSGYINIVAEGFYLPAFWAHPEIGGRFPGLVLIHEWWGLTSHVRTQVRRFAEVGFYVIAPDLYDGKIARTAEEALALSQALGDAGPVRVNAAISALKTHNRCNGKIAVIGFQMGGEMAYHAALHHTDLRAAVVFYGKPDDFLPMMPADETPILAFYGDQDPAAPPDVLKHVREALAAAPGHGEVVVYPGATSEFFDDEGANFLPNSASDAWSRTLDFLTIHTDLGKEKTDSNPKVVL